MRIQPIQLATALLFFITYNASAAVAVKVATAKQVEYAKPVQLSGVIQNKTQQKLAFKIPGLIQHIAVNEGQVVKQGDILASLDLQEIQADVSQAKANVVLAQNDFQRAQTLQQKNMLSDSQLDYAKAQLQVAQAAQSKAEFNLRHAQIIAPHDGTILKRFVEQHEMVAAGTPAFLLSNHQDGWVFNSAVADQDFVSLQLNDRVEIRLSALPDLTLSAQVSQLAATADHWQTYAIELQVQQNNKLLQGLVGHAVITPSKTQSRVLIPVTALVRSHRSQTVRAQAQHSELDIFVLGTNATAQLRKVALDTIDGEFLVISQGLSDGEKVITQGASLLRDGQRVQVQE